MKVIAMVVLAACTGGGSGGPDQTLVELENEGKACLFADPSRDPAARSFSADRPVEIDIDYEVCLSSSCDHDRMASCTVTVLGSTITITTYASWRTPTGDATCTADCGFLTSTCQTPPLAAGDYTFVLDGRSLALTVPSTTIESPCL